MAIVNLDLYSCALAMNTQATLILPERRGVPVTAHDAPYPVLYLLHGHGQDHTSWLRLSRIELYLQNTDLIVVMPNGNRGGYTDGLHTHHYGTYLTQELPRTLRNWFNISADREHTFIAGPSMGGYGSLRAALSCPERYGAVCAMSTAVTMFDFLGINRPDLGLAIPSDPEVPANIENIYGPRAQYGGSENDLRTLAKRLNDSGSVSPRILSLCGSEDPLCAYNQAFADYIHTDCPKLDFTFRTAPGIHDFNFWDSCLGEMFRFFGLM